MIKAIICIYHGSSDETINNKTSKILNKLVKNTFTSFNHYEVFLSNVVNDRLDNKRFELEECLNNLINLGYRDVYILMVSIISGSTRDYVINITNKYQDKLNIKVSSGLIDNYSDAMKLAKILKNDKPCQYLYLGHGSKDISQISYENLERAFKDLGYFNHFVDTLSNKNLIHDLENKLCFDQKIYLYPLTFICGKHATNDIENEIFNKLIKLGYDIEYIEESLGMNKDVLDLYILKLRKIIYER